jgi:protein arginine N-methyltransferase 1
VLDYHRGLLADELRTRAYRDAIARVVKPGDVVVDLGCGTGILSLFACEAGASRVFAIDMGHMADVAALLMRHAGVADRVTVLHEESTKVELPVRADVLVTETMGPFGLDEGIVGYLLDARRRLLRPDAMIIPRQLTVSAVPLELTDEYAKRVAWWSEPHFGFDLSPVRVLAANSRYFAYLEKSWRIGTPAGVLDVDLATTETTLNSGRATFTAERDATLHGFGLWFTASLTDGITLTNRDKRPATSWAQGYLPLEREIAVTRGATIELDLETDDGKWWRWRGSAAGTAFDQSTWFSMPPCGAVGSSQ